MRSALSGSSASASPPDRGRQPGSCVVRGSDSSTVQTVTLGGASSPGAGSRHGRLPATRDRAARDARRCKRPITDLSPAKPEVHRVSRTDACLPRQRLHAPAAEGTRGGRSWLQPAAAPVSSSPFGGVTMVFSSSSSGEDGKPASVGSTSRSSGVPGRSGVSLPSGAVDGFRAVDRVVAGLGRVGVRHAWPVSRIGETTLTPAGWARTPGSCQAVRATGCRVRGRRGRCRVRRAGSGLGSVRWSRFTPLFLGGAFVSGAVRDADRHERSATRRVPRELGKSVSSGSSGSFVTPGLSSLSDWSTGPRCVNLVVGRRVHTRLVSGVNGFGWRLFGHVLPVSQYRRRIPQLPFTADVVGGVGGRHNPSLCSSSAHPVFVTARCPGLRRLPSGPRHQTHRAAATGSPPALAGKTHVHPVGLRGAIAERKAGHILLRLIGRRAQRQTRGC